MFSFLLFQNSHATTLVFVLRGRGQIDLYICCIFFFCLQKLVGMLVGALAVDFGSKAVP